MIKIESKQKKGNKDRKHNNVVSQTTTFSLKCTSHCVTLFDIQLSADQISDEIHLSRNISKLLSWNCAGKSYLRTSRIVSGRGLFVSLRRYAWSFQLDLALLLAFSFQFSWITSTKTVRKLVSLLSSIELVVNFTTQLVLYQLGILMCLRISWYIPFVMIIISVDSACVTN